jgi:hypothetical protein
MRGRLSRRVLLAAFAIALAPPAFYLAWLAAEVDPARNAATGKKTASETTALPPALPDFDGCVLNFAREDGARHEYVASDLPPETLEREAAALMEKNGWEADGVWCDALNSATEGGRTLVFVNKGWRCQMLVGRKGNGSVLTLFTLPAP